MPTRLLLVALLGLAPASALDAPDEAFERLPPVRGSWGNVMVEEGETLLDVAFRHRLGFEAVQRLNPGVDPWIPPVGSVVRLPTRYVLPDAAPEGLVVNIPEMRLFDFTALEGPTVYSLAVGDAEDPTPIGEFRVGEKRSHPAWRVPRSIREERPELPAVVPPGPDNPLGSRWLTVGRTSYGIHGTNVRWSIGREATHGCIRLYDDEMRLLYERIPSGTRLQLVYQTAKWGRDGDAIVLEAHPDLYARIEDPLAEALARPAELGLLEALDLEQVRRALAEARGTPVPVGRYRPRPAPTSPPTS